MGWMQKTCAHCGGELWVMDDWDRIPEYHKECAWREVTYRICGKGLQVRRDWENPPTAHKECREREAERWYEQPCQHCGGPISVCRDWPDPPDYHKECAWREVACASCGGPVKVHRSWPEIPRMHKKCREELAPVDAICTDCGGPFTVSTMARLWYRENGRDLPGRCKGCREQRRLVLGALGAVAAQYPFPLRGEAVRREFPLVPETVVVVRRRDPDVAYQAYSVLSEHVPELGNPDDIPYWLSHRRAEIDRLLAWWKDEMDGKHHDVPSAAGQAALIRALRGAGKTDVSRNPAEVALFSPAVGVRMAAVALLGESPSVDDIPYLELTLRVPDAGAAYSAYALLWRLLHLPGAAVPIAHFKAHWAEDSDPERHWWWDELNADHITDENLRRRIGLGPLKPPPVTEIHAGTASGPGSPQGQQTNGPRPGKP